MKKIKLFIILFPLFLFSIERPQLDRSIPPLEKDFEFTKPQYGYWYASGGCTYLVPKINYGYRFQKDLTGGDFFLEVGTLGSSLSFAGLGYNPLLYFYPGEKTQTYLGLGAGGYICLLDSAKIPSFSINVLAGLQFKVKEHYHFIEAKITAVSFYFWSLIFLLPLPSISYGVSF